MNELQMDIDFKDTSKHNRLKESLNQGKFTLLFECSTPGVDNAPDSVKQKIANFEAEVLKLNSMPTGLAIADGINSAESWRAADFASALSPDNRDRHLLYISGRNSDIDKIHELTSIANDAGIYNLVATSGHANQTETGKDLRKRLFTESIQTLEAWQNQPSLELKGAVINPFQYTSYSQFAQNSKLVKKINAGASLIVAQAGWDMLKLQALRWFMNIRNFCVPTIERLLILTPERVEKIVSGRYSGVNISPDFHALLTKETQFSFTQFEAAQWRRVELQAAGCQLMGFNGIQLAGIDNVATIKIAAERIESALNEFTSFDYWLSEYNSYLAKTEMAPFTGSFYLFDRILKRNSPDSKTQMRDLGVPTVKNREKARYFTRKFFFAHANKEQANSRMLLKKILCRCQGCNSCTLPDSEFICVKHCPKKLSNGVCGDILPNGDCNIQGVGECVHRRIARIAHWQKEANELEDRVILK